MGVRQCVQECRRAQRLAPRRDHAPLSPGFAMPPFHPDHPPRPAVPRRPTRPRRYVRPDGATVSGLLTALCVATLLVTLAVAY
ncbi:hypothetical protein [Streptomyces mutabilis]|uniref:Uncharacterized protein n=1 Tax=Streptomyces mutabilis TaxID=67332 RepID=A0A086MTD2_9ACTN|nr:hypothetical protein [Streptomyces mutabilis]KFG72150.1 hypothetical protein FM21_28655 [Streptomyces mutabilis]